MISRGRNGLRHCSVRNSLINANCTLILARTSVICFVLIAIRLLRYVRSVLLITKTTQSFRFTVVVVVVAVVTSVFLDFR